MNHFPLRTEQFVVDGHQVRSRDQSCLAIHTNKKGGSWPPFHFVPRGKYQNGLTEPRKQTDEIVIQ